MHKITPLLLLCVHKNVIRIKREEKGESFCEVKNLGGGVRINVAACWTSCSQLDDFNMYRQLKFYDGYSLLEKIRLYILESAKETGNIIY